MLWLVVRSPFGRALAAIRENEARTSSLGYNVPLYKLAAFTLAGAVAGYAGGLACQQAEVLFARGDVVRGLGGRARGDHHRRYRGRSSARILGAAFYYIVRDELSDVFESHWQLVLGIVFILVVYLLPGGLVGGGRRLWQRFAR